MTSPTARSIIWCFTLAPLKLASAYNQMHHARPAKGLMDNGHSVFVVDVFTIIVVTGRLRELRDLLRGQPTPLPWLQIIRQ